MQKTKPSLENAIKYYPYKITKVLTDNKGEFTNKTHYKYNDNDNNSNDNSNNNDNINNQEQLREQKEKNTIEIKEANNNQNQNKQNKEDKDKNNNKEKINKKTLFFDKICEIYSIEHRLTKPYHPQTNGMVERMNGKRKECFKI